MCANSYQQLLAELVALLERSHRLRARGERIDAEIALLNHLIAELNHHPDHPPRTERKRPPGDDNGDGEHASAA